MTKGERAIAFIEQLRGVDGELGGKRIRLQPWQKQYILHLLDTKQADGLRQYRESFVFLPRKNGKSTIIAALCLFFLLCDGEYGCRIYSAAGTKDQASEVFKIARAMIGQNRTLKKLLKVNKTQREITFDKTNSVYKAIAADADNAHGGNAHVVIADEVHVWKGRDLYDVLKTSQASRRQPLFISITTAGFDKTSLCYELYIHAKRVAKDPAYDPRFLPLVYEAPEGADWQAESTWIAANPNYGVSVSKEYMADAVQKAKTTPSYLNTFLRLHLNIWTDSDVAWIDETKWLACGTLDVQSLANQRCSGGLDLASTTDTASFVMSFNLPDGRVALLPRIYIPKDTAHEKERIDNIPYTSYAKQGFVKLTPGNVIDHQFIRKDINELAKLYKIDCIAFDRIFADNLSQELKADGFNMVKFGQGFLSLSEPSKKLERHYLSQKLLHPNNLLFNKQCISAVLEIDAAENIKPTKARSTGRIDSLVAAIMAIGVGGTPPPDDYKGLLLL